MDINSSLLDAPNPSAPGIRTLGYQQQQQTVTSVTAGNSSGETMQPCCFINISALNMAVLSISIINIIFGLIITILSVLFYYIYMSCYMIF